LADDDVMCDVIGRWRGLLFFGEGNVFRSSGALNASNPLGVICLLF
jgi:hypothetical protein